MALVNKDAAMIVKDTEANDRLMAEACSLIKDQDRVAALEENIGKLALRDAAMTIVDEIYRILK
jgi:UDP-N-acetylglucosamine--N-acetylmuramyl-(pentapeptide) pyrophosphoryl-undecaprenol N-acetylglucosamine transferase